MFIIPSLRARKPGKVEKKALDIAFLLTPLVSIGLPFATRVRACAVRVRTGDLGDLGGWVGGWMRTR